MRIGSLFSGAGGLDMAVEEVFGGEVIWQAEVDKAASKVLAYRFPCAPNLGDITQIDWTTVEPVDVLCGGFPCQDVSAAGKRAGIKAGTRSGLWSVFAEAIDQLRPPLVVIENVRGLLSAQAHRNVEPDEGTMGDRSDRPVLRALGAVLGDLADLGYDAQWATVAAADVGAPHRRERVFILAADAAGAGAGDNVGRLRRLSQQGASSSADSSVHGRDEGRPESARIVGEFDAALGGDEPGVALLPTPCVVDRLATTDMTLEQWDESRRSQKERGVGSFGPRGDSLGAAVLRVEEGTVDERPDYSSSRKDDGVALLPTPTCQVGANTAGPSQFDRNSLPLNAVATLLPTPSLSDTKTPRRGQQLTATIASGIHTLNLSDAIEHQHGRDSVHQAWGKYEPAIRRWEALTRPAPAPTEPNKNGNPRLSAAFSEWLMGWPHYWVTDPDIGISRNDQLKIVGNGVCPQQAAAALRYLLTVAEAVA